MRRYGLRRRTEASPPYHPPSLPGSGALHPLQALGKHLGGDHGLRGFSQIGFETDEENLCSSVLICGFSNSNEVELGGCGPEFSLTSDLLRLLDPPPNKHPAQHEPRDLLRGLNSGVFTSIFLVSYARTREADKDGLRRRAVRDLDASGSDKLARSLGKGEGESCGEEEGAGHAIGRLRNCAVSLAAFGEKRRNVNITSNLI